MSILSEERIAILLRPYLDLNGLEEGGSAGMTPVPRETLLPQLSLYLELLLRWNQKTNLTAITDPERIVTRHFGESLFAARALALHVEAGSEVLDLGSGAGFPGLPLQLLLPRLQVTLAESQGKKAAFLREAVRELQVRTEVWAARAEDFPIARTFHAVTLRAVDRPAIALAEAKRRLNPGGWLLELKGRADQGQDTFEGIRLPIPGMDKGVVNLRRY